MTHVTGARRFPYGYHEDRTPTYDYEATRAAAMAPWVGHAAKSHELIPCLPDLTL
jgi:hypothetical protein